MLKEEQMTINERRKYLRLIKRGCLLDEMEAVTGLHRKSLIRLLSGSLERNPRHKHRGRKYGPGSRMRCGISESLDHICEKSFQRQYKPENSS